MQNDFLARFQAGEIERRTLTATVEIGFDAPSMPEHREPAYCHRGADVTVRPQSITLHYGRNRGGQLYRHAFVTGRMVKKDGWLGERVRSVNVTKELADLLTANEPAWYRDARAEATS